MEECPLIQEFAKNPMLAREFVENHARLPLWVRLFHMALSAFVQ
jgi:hypothetical protein